MMKKRYLFIVLIPLIVTGLIGLIAWKIYFEPDLQPSKQDKSNADAIRSWIENSESKKTNHTAKPELNGQD